MLSSPHGVSMQGMELMSEIMPRICRSNAMAPSIMIGEKRRGGRCASLLSFATAIS
jgi:hypothetical protein